MAQKVFVIGDMHSPWVDIASLNKVYLALAKENQIKRVDAVVQIGDLYDMYSFSKFARTHDLTTPKQELQEGRALAEAFWKNVKDYSPDARRYQIKGNHDTRIVARATEKYAEILSLLNIDHLWKFPGVTTIDDAREELKIDGVNYIHGYRSKLGDHMRYMLESVVCGHSHQGGVLFMPIGVGKSRRCLFELNVGFIADDTGAVPLQYSKQKTNRWTKGYGIVDEQGPRFCPL